MLLNLRWIEKSKRKPRWAGRHRRHGSSWAEMRFEARSVRQVLRVLSRRLLHSAYARWL
ncbi:MAG: hypothetical protein OJF60_000272 [Burkholderiaceae bacterium]|nr:MAG: hypothetical protein OJF60_000272 [Burkholderiaceae bacterium]